MRAALVSRVHRTLHSRSRATCDARTRRGYNSIVVMCGGLVGRVSFGPQHDAAQERAMIEWARRNGVAAPHVLDHWSDDGAQVLVYEEIRGDVDSLDRGAVRSVATQLAQLHAGSGAPSHSARAHSLERCKEALDAAVAFRMDGSVRDLIRDSMESGLPGVPLHGDVRPPNLVRRAGARTGFIDWSDAHVGVAEADVALLPSRWWRPAMNAYTEAGGRRLNTELLIGFSAARVYALAARGAISAQEVDQWTKQLHQQSSTTS